MRTIGFINWKGGVGKTTIAINTACALGHFIGNSKILLIDADKQGNASQWFSTDPDKPGLSELLTHTATVKEVIQKTRYSNIDVIGSDASLLDVNIAILKKEKERQDNILKQALAPIKEEYDFCVIDNPPDSNISVLNGLVIVDDLIAVTLANRFAAEGIRELQEEIDNYNQILGLSIKIAGVVINQLIGCPNEIYSELAETYYMMPSLRGGHNTQYWLDKSINERRSIFEISPRSGYARDFKKFIQDLIDIILSSYRQTQNRRIS